jgi:hypothetical protein
MLYFFHSTKHSKISKPNKGETSIQQLKTFSPNEINIHPGKWPLQNGVYV